MPVSDRVGVTWKEVIEGRQDSGASILERRGRMVDKVA